MSYDTKVTKTAAAPEVTKTVAAPEASKAKLGKAYKGQSFVPVIAVEDVIAQNEAQKPFDKPGAVDLSTYMAMRGFRDPAMRAAMQTYTKVQRATPEDWDTIFTKF